MRLTRSAGRRPVLRGASLRIEPGETVALVGASGAGKSSVAALLLAFLRPDHGQVLIDGRPLDSLDPAAWRSRVAWVPQSPTIFSGTVAHNIALGEPTAPRRAVEEAAVRAGVHEVISDLPDGYDTQLGEGGHSLSGGQRQRLAIARAHLRDAPLVVFDEFTAQLDHATEAGVLDAARELLRGRSALLIAHRPATALMADRIAVMADGRVLDSGCHPDLFDRCAEYRRLVETPGTAEAEAEDPRGSEHVVHLLGGTRELTGEPRS